MQMYSDCRAEVGGDLNKYQGASSAKTQKL